MIEAQTNPTLAPYAKTGEVHLRITAKGEDEKSCKKLIKPVVKELQKRFGKNVFALDADKTLEESVVDLLKEKELTLSLAESCTGGAIAARIVNVPGASQVFTHGFVTYSNRAKRECLGVKKSTLKTVGAVSAKCAKQMAKGAAQLQELISVFLLPALQVRMAEPVRLLLEPCLWVAAAMDIRYPGISFYRKQNQIRQQAVASALVLLRECMMGEVEE